MISNLSSQLKEQGHIELMPEVLAEVPRVRKELGYPPLVTPTSQIVGTQATLNVVMGRYKMITKETRAYVQGLYGQAPGPIDPEVQKLCIGDETPITGRPADLLEPELPKRRAELEELGIKFSDEDLISYALFPQVALEFFARRDRTERPKEEAAALAAVVADLLGVQEEACVSPQVVVVAADSPPAEAKVGADLPEAGVAGRPPSVCPYGVPGSAWAAAGRRDLTAGRPVSWRY